MKDHGMTFRSDLALAIREGWKTQTRRLIDPQPVRQITPIMGTNRWASVCDMDGLIAENIICPWQVGDRIFVQEEWAWPGEEQVIYRGDPESEYLVGLWEKDPNCPQITWEPAKTMPADAARTCLEITEIRVERIQEISEEDAIAEGIRVDEMGHVIRENDDVNWGGPRFEFAEIWNSIYSGSWERNEWVWVLSLKRLDENPLSPSARIKEKLIMNDLEKAFNKWLDETQRYGSDHREAFEAGWHRGAENQRVIDFEICIATQQVDNFGYAEDSEYNAACVQCAHEIRVWENIHD